MSNGNTKYIAYYRTSTADQHNGIDAQRTSATNFLKEGEQIVKEYKEHQSGRKVNREELMKAIDECNRNGYKLLIARLDRLSRNASFTLSLQDSGVDFVCADMPKANSLTIGIMSLLAEEEAKRVSKNTILALKEVAKRKKLGTNNLTIEGRRKGAERNKDQAKKDNHQVTKIIVRMRNEGETFQAIADELNADGYTTSKGGKFVGQTVGRLYKRPS